LFQAPQRGGTRPGIPPERARRLESILVQGTPAVGEETAEARDDNREQIPPRQSRSLLHPEDTLIGAVIAGERNEQAATRANSQAQRRFPSTGPTRENPAR